MGWDEDSWFRRWGRWPFFDFEQIERMFDDMFREAFERIPKEFFREERLPDGRVSRRVGPFVYGYSMTIGPDGKPVIREFGNMRPSSRPTAFGGSRPTLDVREEREPLVDVFSDDGTIRVIAELPGVDKRDIRLACSERKMTISVDSEMRKYYKEVDLPAEVDPRVSKAKYTNGVLEVTLTKARGPTGEQIRIE